MSAKTKNDALRSSFVKLILAAACVSTGLFVTYLALDMVSMFGERMGVDAKSQKIYGNAHMAVHVFGSICALLVVAFRASGQRALSWFAAVLMLLCGGYGVINMIGFTSTNRVAVAELRESNTSNAWKAYEAQREAIMADIKWAQGAVIEEEDPREKKRLYARIDAKQKELAAITPPQATVATVLADPQATLFERLLGGSAANWRLALPIPLAFLLYLAEVFSFIFAAHLIFSVAADWRAMRQEDRAGTPDARGATVAPCTRDAGVGSHDAKTAECHDAKMGCQSGAAEHHDAKVECIDAKAELDQMVGGSHTARAGRVAGAFQRTVNSQYSSKFPAPRERVISLIRQDCPRISNRAIAQMTGWPRNSVNVLRREVEGRNEPAQWRPPHKPWHRQSPK